MTLKSWPRNLNGKMALLVLGDAPLGYVEVSVDGSWITMTVEDFRRLPVWIS
ncbi:hypothetical protein [Roseococcus sp. YIM B11640]|uniref:hypothetical protein n=1 Tax=Roseococcus sp. YIM B11640 TaxID=3133973 RepID=UPI003C7A10F4